MECLTSTNALTYLAYLTFFRTSIPIFSCRSLVSNVNWILFTKEGRYYRYLNLYCLNTRRFIMFSVITNIYNKKTKEPTLMEFFTATGKLKKFFWQLEMFDVWTTGNTANIDTVFKLLPHTRQHGCIDILHCCNDPCIQVSEVTWQCWAVLCIWISCRCVPCYPWCTHRTFLVVEKKPFQFSCGCEKFH
jgi:hypothetical protein